MPKIATADVIIPDDRQRKDLGDLSELEASLEANNLIQPIVLRNGNTLVAGERRLTAARNLGWEFIDFHHLDDLSEEDAQIVELEENAKRLSLTWPEQVRTIAKIHAILEAKAQRDARPWTASDTARRIAISTQHCSRVLAVADAMERDPEIERIATLSTAYNAVARHNDRRFADAMSSIQLVGFGADLSEARGVTDATPAAGVADLQLDLEAGNPPAFVIEDIASGERTEVALQAPARPLANVPEAKPVPRILPPELSILNEDFIAWANSYTGAPFNFIHCDFPYAAGAGRSGSQINAGGDLGSYEDNEEIFWKLCQTLLDSMGNVVAPSAHIVFWHLSEMTPKVIAYFQEYEKVFDLRIFNIPLIWYKSDNTGVLSDPARRARHIYESALVISRGDRKIVKSVGDVYACPTSRSIHPAEKPQPMLEHFFRMFVSETTRMLDPTCGSGTSIRAAETLGAQTVLGFELDPKFAEESRAELRRFRQKRLLASQTQGA